MRQEKPNYNESKKSIFRMLSLMHLIPARDFKQACVALIKVGMSSKTKTELEEDKAYQALVKINAELTIYIKETALDSSTMPDTNNDPEAELTRKEIKELIDQLEMLDANLFVTSDPATEPETGSVHYFGKDQSRK